VTTQSFRLKLIQLNQHKLKLTQSSQLKLKVTARIPSRIDATAPIEIDRTGGIYTLSLDMNAINDMIGNSFQPVDADLTAIAALTTTAYGRSLLTLTNATALAAEVDSFFLTPTEGNAAYQPLDSDLTAIAALTTTSYGRAFLALADASAARTAVGLGNVDNTSDANKPVSTATQTALNLKANIASPTFTGTPAAPTPSFNDNTTKIGTTAFFFNQVSNATPLGAAAVAAAGTSTLWARADHVHPGREVLTASRTYYVRTDGSDSNTGLVNSAGGAFLTGQKAINTVAGLDLNGQTCTIQFGSGTYTGSINAATPFVGGVPTLQGDTGTPSNVLLNVSSYAIRAANGAEINVAGFKITSTGDALLAENAGRLNVTGNMDYGACTSSHMHAKYAGLITVSANYTVSGNSVWHWWSETAGGSIKVIGRTITITGTPAFAGAWLNATIVAQIVAVSNTYSGSATGARYLVTLNGVGYTSGATLPGNAAGSTATGGQYN